MHNGTYPGCLAHRASGIVANYKGSGLNLVSVFFCVICGEKITRLSFYNNFSNQSINENY